MDVAFTRGATWVINGELGGHVLRIEPETGRTVDTITTGNSPAALAPNGTDLWVADVLDNSVSRVDPTGAVTATIPVGRNPHAIAVGDGAVWVADGLDDDVKRIDLSTAAVVTTIPVGRNPAGIAVGARAVWVANQDDGTVSRIDPRSNTVVKTIRIGGSPGGITVAGGTVWVSAQAQPLTANIALARAGGVARIDFTPDAIDPGDEGTFTAIAGQWEYATCAKLLNYPDRPGPGGSRLQPELARALPNVSPDGKTYSFTIRDGYRFSPPSNQPVTAATAKYTIERSLSPYMHSVAPNYVHDIAGEAKFRAGKAQHIAGVIARGNRLTIKLTRAAYDFPARVAMQFFCAVPTNTPFRRTDMPPIPSAGPYYIASFTPAAEMVLKRNPNYTGPRPRRLKEIVYTGGFSDSQSISRIVSRKTDYVPSVRTDPHLASRLKHQYGPGSRAARAGHQQLFINPRLITDMLTLNTSRPLFWNARLRRAVNYAIDRRALARQGGFFNGPGPLTATPTDQYLAPGIPGVSEQSIYPLGGDLAKARQLAGSRQRTAVLYTCNFAPCPQDAQIVKKDLAAIGMTVEIKTLKSIFDIIAQETKRGEPVDIGLMTWAADYPDPFDFLNLLLDGNLGPNAAQFDEPAYNRRLEAAAGLSGERRYRTYGRLDADLARNAAPFVAFENENSVEFFSARIGCQTYQPVYGMDLAALCIRP
jgi:peptide/nickel transport system substrate-binding protein